MREEIQFEALAQNRVVDFADAALPGGAGIRHHDIDAAEMLRRSCRRPACTEASSVTSQRTASAAPPIALALSCAAFHRDRAGPLRRRPPQKPSRSQSRWRRPAPVIDGDLSGERQFLRAAELGLFERPVFAIEHVLFADRREAADRFGIGDALDRGFGEIGCDPRVLLRAAEPEQAETRHQDHARRGIEHGLAAAEARVVALEICLVVLDEFGRRLARGFAEIGELARRPAPARSSASPWCGWCGRA